MKARWNKWRAAGVCLLLVLVTLGVYWPVTHHDFINYDDTVYLTENPHVISGLTWGGLKWAFTKLHGEATYWHPLTWLSHMLDCQLFGLNPGPHHLVNVLFHAANAMLLFLLLRNLTGAFWRCAAVAMLFAWHPLQVDTVAWAAERKNVLNTLFGFLALLFYTRYAKSKTENRKSKMGTYCLALALFGLGLMCKPALVTLPCLLLLLDFWPLNRIQCSTLNAQRSALPRLILEKIPFFILSAASSVITVMAHQRLGMLDPAYSLGLDLRMENALVSYARYVAKTFWPANLAVCYPHPGNWPFAHVAGSLLLLLLITGLAIWQIQRRPFLLVGWLWFLGVLVPTIGLVQAGTQSMADRFAYVPIVGVFIFVVWGLHECSRRTPLLKLIATLVITAALVGCLVRTSFQIRYWQDSVTLFTHALSVTRNNFVAHNNLGVAMSALGNTKAAITHFSEALRINPRDAELQTNIGVALADEGRTEEAFAHYSEALRINPNHGNALNQMGILLSQEGRHVEARPYLEAALNSKAQFSEAHSRLALTLVALGRYQEAISSYREALRLGPNLLGPLNNLAWLLATNPDPTLRDGPEAVRLAEHACKLTQRRTAVLVGTLAAAYAEVGRFDDAVAAGEKARELALAAGQDALAEKNKNLVELYRARQPYREPPAVSKTGKDNEIERHADGGS
ncbi:MAG: tetratricopeptide repeat protein [Verrucomicrobia bacterium]|jgi:tetratricopeptide (TPR) repeat protein|nr:tetratricopeptide repeat protein [Verrucomicrobiota bacterium]